MSVFCCPFLSFHESCYRLEASVRREHLTITDLKPVHYDRWIQNEKERLYWQFHHLKKSRNDRAAAAAVPPPTVEPQNKQH